MLSYRSCTDEEKEAVRNLPHVAREEQSWDLVLSLPESNVRMIHVFLKLNLSATKNIHTNGVG
jgi:hypothetical protein